MFHCRITGKFVGDNWQQRNLAIAFTAPAKVNWSLKAQGRSLFLGSQNIVLASQEVVNWETPKSHATRT